MEACCTQKPCTSPCTIEVWIYFKILKSVCEYPSVNEDALKEKHSTRLKHMQMHIWAEMIQSGIYSSTDDPPSTSMFVWAGADGPNKKKGQQNPVAQAISEAATALTTAFSPNNQRAGTESKCTSGLGIIESWSRLYK